MRSLSRSSLWWLLLGLLCSWTENLGAVGSICLSEWMASNTRTLADEDGDFSDWIELRNISSAPVSLLHWSLTTDGKLRSEKLWSFPATNLGPGEFLVVFASGKNRATPGAPLHTGFKLSKDGEFLALLSPERLLVDGSVTRPYPPQVPDVSFGRGRTSSDVVLVETNTPARFLIPTNPDIDGEWTSPRFDDTGWSSATGPIGYDIRTPSLGTLHSLIRTDIRPQLFARGTSAYLRIPFVVDSPVAFEELALQLHYSDGFTAWLNGIAVAGEGSPDELRWNAAATESRDLAVMLQPDLQLLSREALQSLHPGTNWLAIQGLNHFATNAAFLLRPRLVASRSESAGENLRYFTAPTPGGANALGSGDLGPILHDLSNPPAVVRAGEPVFVTVRALAAFTNVTSVELRYRRMFESEQRIPMTDDGSGADQKAKDGLYSAAIRLTEIVPGEMLRWYVIATDAAGRSSRFPLFENPSRDPAYVGTMMQPTLPTALPVLHWFVQDFRAADTFQGTRCSVFFDGELYDNVLVRLRGFGSTLYPKHSYKFDFNPGQWFRFDPKESRVEEINLNTTSSDQTYIRQSLSWDTFRDAGSPYAISFPMRVQTNAQFYSVAAFVEQPDATMLRRNGLNPSGTLYKMFSNLSAVGASEKKLPKDSDTSDLQDLVDGIASGDLKYLYDHVNLPAFINYLAVNTLIHDNDSIGKNYYLYRDPQGTGEWQPIPWDKDLTFGENFSTQVSETLWADADTAREVFSTHSGTSPSHPLFGDRRHQKFNGDWNRLTDALYRVPEIRDMYLRRLRTLMDQLLQSPDTPAHELRYERKLDEWLHRMSADAALDRQKHGSMFAKPLDMGAAAYALHTQYLVRRRIHLFVTHNETNVTRKVDSARIPEPVPPDPVIQLGFVERAAARGHREWEYVELFNPNTFAVDLSGWELRGNIRHRIAPGTVLPAAGTLYLAADATAFRRRPESPTGNEGLFVQGNFEGELGGRAGSVELWDGTRQVWRADLEDQTSDAQRWLRIVRIGYHPFSTSIPGRGESEQLEFLELRNIGPAPLDLDGIRFTRGIQFEFGSGSIHQLPATEDPGAEERSVFVVKNRAAFEAWHTAEPRIAGEYTGLLDNSGETIRLEDASGGLIQEFQYDPEWQPMSDGEGFSLVHDPLLPLSSWNDPQTWTVGAYEGFPGPLPPARPEPPTPPVVINEILANPLPGLPEAIELVAPLDADLSGWFLSDDFRQPQKYQFPPGTLMRAGEHRVITGYDFGRPSGGYPGFHLNAAGESVYLFAATPSGRLTGYFHSLDFGASPEGLSYGRFFDRLGQEHWTLQELPTLGSTNGLPALGPLVITELHYHAPAQDRSQGLSQEESSFIEIHNPTDEIQTLFSPLRPGNFWRLRGEIDFDFPTRLRLAPQSFALVVSFDPDRYPAKTEAFRSRYGVDPAVPLLGPWRGSLSRSRGSIRLEAPLTTSQGEIGWSVLDVIDYRDNLPDLIWADGSGASLTRTLPMRFGGDPTSWFAALPTPGTATIPGGLPSILIQPRSLTQPAYSSTVLSVLADGSAGLAYQWRRNGEAIASATNAVLNLPSTRPDDSGNYDVLIMSRSGVILSRPGVVTFVPAPILYSQPQLGTVVFGSNYTLRVVADGTPPVRYQWLRNGMEIPAASGPEYSIVGANPDQEGIYSVLVSDANARVESAPVRMTVLFPPRIQRSPESQMVTVGQGIRLEVRATGTPPLTYLWRKNGRFYQATSEPSLIIPSAALTNAGPYAVVVSNVVTSLSRGVITPEANVLVLSDTDGDGMPDIWELTYQFRFDDPRDADQDADFDGMTNLEEYLAGTDPLDPTDYLRIVELKPISRLLDQGLLSFQSISNRSYTVQFKETVSGSWSNWLSFPALVTNYGLSIPIRFDSTAPRLYRVVTPRLTDPELNPAPTP